MNRVALMKRLAQSALAALVAYGPACSMAASGLVKGQVEWVRTHDAGAIPNWAPPLFWVTLKGVSQAGNCQKFTGGSVLFVARDKQALSTVLTAQATGQEIAIAFDDSLVVNSYCLALFITIGNPAPAF